MKNTSEWKRARASRKKRKKQRRDRQERQEGATYAPGAFGTVAEGAADNVPGRRTASRRGQGKGRARGRGRRGRQGENGHVSDDEDGGKIGDQTEAQRGRERGRGRGKGKGRGNAKRPLKGRWTSRKKSRHLLRAITVLSHSFTP